MAGLARQQPLARGIDDLEDKLVLAAIAPRHPAMPHRYRASHLVDDVALDDQPVGIAGRADIGDVEPGAERLALESRQLVVLRRLRPHRDDFVAPENGADDRAS